MQLQFSSGCNLQYLEAPGSNLCIWTSCTVLSNLHLGHSLYPPANIRFPLPNLNNESRRLTGERFQSIVPPEGFFPTVIWIGTAVPPPPQLRHFVYPVWPHALQPASPSDHFAQKHNSTPVPPQAGQGSRPSSRSCSGATFWLKAKAPQMTATDVANTDTACAVEATPDGSASPTAATAVRCRGWLANRTGLTTARRRCVTSIGTTTWRIVPRGRPMPKPAGTVVSIFVSSDGLESPLAGHHGVRLRDC